MATGIHVQGRVCTDWKDSSCDLGGNG